MDELKARTVSRAGLKGKAWSFRVERGPDLREAARAALGEPGDEAATGTRGEDAPVAGTDLLERVLEPDNLRRALHQGRRHQGAPGIDGMTGDDLGAYLKTPWPTIHAAVLAGRYVPQPVRRTDIPKPRGGTRNLGIPTGLDRFIEQALLQVLQEAWDPTFSESREVPPYPDSLDARGTMKTNRCSVQCSRAEPALPVDV